MTKYFALNEQTAVEYIRGCAPAHALLRPDEALTCREVGDGNLNLIFIVASEAEPARSLVLKQALPYVRLVGESWPLSEDRARIEAQALAIHERLCPDLVPHTYHYDATMCLTVMEDLNPAIIMRKGLIRSTRYPHFAAHIGEFLAQTLFTTSDLSLDSGVKKDEVARFINKELCKLTEDVIFTQPYIAGHPMNKNNPLIEARAAELRANGELRREARVLKWAFMTRAEALVHGDLHTGSIMVTATTTKVIDPEFAFYGPMGFDVGAVIGNLLLSYCSHLAHSPDADARASYQGYLLTTIAEVWATFERRFLELWRAADPEAPADFRHAFLRSLLQDTAGFAAAKMIRRILGVAHVEDLESIADAALRARAETWALDIATPLMLRRGELSRIDELVALARAVPAPA
jgi:5-methylthioribose kinase